MSKIITKVTYTEDVAICTLTGFPDDIAAISGLFNEISKNKINVDMISHTTSVGKALSLSFSFSDKDLPAVLEIVAKFKTDYPTIRIDVNPGNCKFSFYGEEMRAVPGVAAFVFSSLSDAGIAIKLITTSTVDISIIINNMDIDACCNVSKNVFKISPALSINY